MNWFRRFAIVLLVLIMLAGCACAEVDTALLEAMQDAQVFMDDNGVDTVIRPGGQPAFGEVDMENAGLCVFLDFVEMPDLGDPVLIRLTLALETWEQLGADRISIQVGKENYIFDVSVHTSEYDMTYYEDYAFCLTDRSLPMLKAMGGGKSDDWKIVFYGRRETAGTIHLSRSLAKSVYNLYVKAKGNKQDLELFRDVWPCTVEKVR